MVGLIIGLVISVTTISVDEQAYLDSVCTELSNRIDADTALTTEECVSELAFIAAEAIQINIIGRNAERTEKDRLDTISDKPGDRAICGDGDLDRGEECDLGRGNNSNTLPDTCRESCLNPFCGDGVVDTGEICDDRGDTGDTSTCSDDCQTVE